MSKSNLYKFTSPYATKAMDISNTLISILDLTGEIIIDKLLDKKGLDNQKALRSDWENVGHDLSFGFQEYNKELEIDEIKKILTQYLELIEKLEIENKQKFLSENDDINEKQLSLLKERD